MQLCKKCGETKPLEAFRKGHGSPCKLCRSKQSEAWRKKNLVRCAELTRMWHKRNPERSRDMYRCRKYKLKRGDFDKMFKDQDSKCAICGEVDPKGRGGFHVDHCHETEKVRGILCHNCNLGIGNLQHDPRIMRAALEYLLKANDQR